MSVTLDFQLRAVPLQSIVDQSEQGLYQNKPAHVFPFEAISQAHELMEQNQAQGKIVITL